VLNPTRGLRQGDPMSLFLFILVVEGLGRYVKEKVKGDQFIGRKMWGNDFPLTHQHFVAGIMVLWQETLKEARGLNKILNNFTNTSRVEINKDKSDIFLFNTKAPSQAFLAIIMGFRIGNISSKYL